MIPRMIHSFDDTTSTGLDIVPVNDFIYIESTGQIVILEDKTSITGATTISTFLGWTSQWSYPNIGQLTAAGVTYENLNTNGDVGTGATQVAQGSHTHATYVLIASPSISADLDANNNDLNEVKTVQFNGLYDNGTKTTGWTMTLANGQYQKVTLGANTTLTITPPTGAPSTMYLHIYQDATGSRTLTLPSGMWEGGTAGSLTTTASALDILMIHYTGSAYVYSLMNDVKTPA